MAEFPIKTERELLDRLAYSGPLQDRGHGVNIAYTWTGAVTDAVLWTPATGNRFVVSNIIVNTSGACTVAIFDDDESTIDTLFKGALGANATVVIPYNIPRPSAGVNRSLRITTSATGGFVQVWGWKAVQELNQQLLLNLLHLHP